MKGLELPGVHPRGSIVYALAAGNAVVFKPSELTPAVGCFLADTFVDADADLDAAAEQALWGGMANAGQTCLAVERVYVVDQVDDRFLAKLVERASRVRPGPDPGADFGPITLPRQLQTIQRHLDDALARGARALVGGRDAVRPPYVEPVVLVDVPADALVLREETFGPVLAVVRARDAGHAVALANANPYGLGAAVFASRRAERIARALRSGMASNSVLTYAGMPSLPFGGVGESGFGSIHGPGGLREFTRPKAITRQRFPCRSGCRASTAPASSSRPSGRP